MDRRNALAALSGVAAAALLVARTGKAFAQTTTSAANVTVLGDDAYKTRTLTVGTLSKQMSLLAVAQATNPKIKEFAQFEIDEQTSMAQVLTDMTNPPPAPLDEAHKASLAQLQRVQGKAFDTAYIMGEIAGHEQLMSIQQDFLNGVPTDRDHEHIAILARTVIQMHLTMLQDLQRMIGAA